MIRATGKLVAGLLLLLGLLAGSAEAASLQLVGRYDQPIYVTSDPGNPDRLFVVERQGVVRQVEAGSTSVFADIRPLVSCCEGERGLLSIALAPDFDASGRFYVDYTGEQEPGEIHVAEMRANGGFAPASSIRDLLTIPHPGESNHYGGQLQFGPEGDLFISTGDGGGGDDVHHNAQSLGSLLGKILRVSPDPVGVLPYGVPTGNPLPALAAPFDSIWSYGLRNPFRFSFDRREGSLAIGDVGQEAWEEVDYAPAPGLGAGADYGWNCREGFEPGPAGDPECATTPPTSFVDPIFAYPHDDPEDGGAHGCAIIGGYVARGPGLGDLYGRYLYGDLCVGQLRSFSPAAPSATDRSEGLKVEGLNSFGEDSCGRLYAVSGEGPVYRLAGSEAASCEGSPLPRPPLQPTRVGIRALSRKVVRNRRTMITAWVSPCAGHRGEPVNLWRGRRRIGTRHLDRVCSVRFRPRISRRSRFRATVKANAEYAEGYSRLLKVLPRRRHPHR